MTFFSMFSTKKYLYRMLFVISALSLSGCGTFTGAGSADDAEKIEHAPAAAKQQAPVKSQLINDDANEFLTIAKELYAAGQYEQAYKIAQRLAVKNMPEAQYLLGYLLYNGEGVAANRKEGRRWIETAADVGYRPAIEGLVMIDHGLSCQFDSGQLQEVDVYEDKKETLLQEGEILITPGKR